MYDGRKNGMAEWNGLTAELFVHTSTVLIWLAGIGLLPVAIFVGTSNYPMAVIRDLVSSGHHFQRYLLLAIVLFGVSLSLVIFRKAPPLRVRDTGRLDEPESIAIGGLTMMLLGTYFGSQMIRWLGYTNSHVSGLIGGLVIAIPILAFVALMVAGVGGVLEAVPDSRVLGNRGWDWNGLTAERVTDTSTVLGLLAAVALLPVVVFNIFRIVGPSEHLGYGLSGGLEFASVPIAFVVVSLVVREGPPLRVRRGALLDHPILVGICGSVLFYAGWYFMEKVLRAMGFVISHDGIILGYTISFAIFTYAAFVVAGVGAILEARNVRSSTPRSTDTTS